MADDRSDLDTPEDRRIRLWLREHGDDFNDLDWWIVDIVCRQGRSLESAARSLGVPLAAAEAAWAGLADRARRNMRPG